MIAKSERNISAGFLERHLNADIRNIPHTRLEVWDYLVGKDFPDLAWDWKGSIVFAGNLNRKKCPGYTGQIVFGLLFFCMEITAKVFMGSFSGIPLTGCGNRRLYWPVSARHGQQLLY